MSSTSHRPKTVEPAVRVEDPVAIDPDALDVEVREQPRRARAAGRELAKAELAANRAKAKFELVEADLKVRIRLNPERYSLPAKPAMELVEAAVICERAYQKAQDEMFLAFHERDFVKAEREALRDRKGMLEKAVDLLRSDYNSEPRLRGDAREFSERQLKSERRGVRQ